MKQISSRVASVLVVLLLSSLAITFMVGRMPGDPAYTILGDHPTHEQVIEVHRQLRVGEPFVHRYAGWLGDALHGDFGTSLRTQEPIAHAIGVRFPVSLELMILAQLFAIAIAVPLAVYAAFHPGGIVDRLSALLSFAGISIAPFVTALLLILLFAAKLKWFPAGGYTAFLDNPLQNLRGMVLPALSLALVPMGIYQRVLRSDLATVVREDFILAARAKGMLQGNLMFRQALRPASLGFMTLAGINTATLIGGSVVIESIFALPGLGQFMALSIASRDLVAVQAMVLLIALAYVLINLTIDVLYRFVDPRVTHER